MKDYEKLLTTIKRSLGGILPCHMVGKIAKRVADVLIVEGESVREDEGE